jgi:hypothetical protein
MEAIERELDHRNGDGVDVTLLWEPETNSMVVVVVDGSRSFRIEVDPADALDAFHHPCAYDGVPGASLT